MNITYNRLTIAEIKTHTELENFLINKKIFKLFKKFSNSDVLKIQNNIDQTEVLKYKQIKPWLKNILEYPETIYDKKFLRCMGWDDIEIISFISKRQKQNSKVLSDKKLNNPEFYYDKTTSRIEYWISKGYSADEAKIKLTERQRTFSKEICIKKYGEDLGNEVFKLRQQKWINTLQSLDNYDQINLKKNAYNYIQTSYNQLINRASFSEKTKEVILKYIDSSNINDFVDNVLSEIDVKRYSDMSPYFSSNIVRTKFKLSSADIKNIFYSKTFYSLSKQTYGIPVYHNNIRFKSVKEYLLALFFEERGIRYVYENNYPNSKFKFDFYLPDKNLYVEYYGMLDGKNENNLNEIQKHYQNKMLIKNLFCQENNLPLIFETNYATLLEKLNKIL
jgi:hypothetical protein